MAGQGLHLSSGLWVDAPDAAATVERRRAAGELSAGDAERLLRFVEEGYVVFPLGVDEALLDAVPAGIEDLWRERPADVAFASDSPALPMSRADEARHRHTRYRIHDLHSHLEAALALYLHPEIHRLARLVLGDGAVAIQSLYFEFGSEQILHRDPVVVPTGRPGHLLAAWIALEDISPDCGALVYIPGSHRLPYYEFAPGEYAFDSRRMGEAEVLAATAFDDEQARRAGLEPRLFTAKKGEVLLWHGSLRHGGAPVRDPRLTRKSLVVHFSTRPGYSRRAITVWDEVDGEERPRVMATERLVERGGAVGFASPMQGEAVPA